MKTIAAALLTSVLATIAAPASAKVYNASANKSPQFFTDTAELRLVDAGGAVALPFTAPIKGIYLVTFTAECMVTGTTAFVSLDVVVDGVAQGATAGRDDGFCAADDTAGFDHPTTHAMTIPVFVKPGNHTVRIGAALVGGPATASIDDLTIVVHD